LHLRWVVVIFRWTFSLCSRNEPYARSDSDQAVLIWREARDIVKVAIEGEGEGELELEVRVKSEVEEEVKL
jgi:hypothetical protein